MLTPLSSFFGRFYQITEGLCRCLVELSSVRYAHEARTATLQVCTARTLPRLTGIVTFCLVFALVPYVLAQPAPGVGSSRPESEYSRHPLKIKLSGFLNTKPEGESLGVIQLGIPAYRETYQFEVISLEAVDRERITPEALLRPSKGRAIAYDLLGSKESLSKIAQSPPGTPLTIIGFLQQREGEIQLVSVEIVGFE